ncbi:hypothetical protein CHS0354_008510 [Potamilus streckersoni]|uniref:Uncharacterized protein n=1 Tax=Potamilus streckersoni TaxID=2493646 RepID=A0AAE0S833_9BIVA|nr:hypothetical protein CHS0354_008510 [Potamilus streckersoni]
MESKAEGSIGDNPNSGSSLVLINQRYGYNHVERFRFRNMFMKILEELRMRRVSDRENEKRIQELVQEKFMLEKKADQESQRCLVLEECHASETRDACMKLEDRMRELKAEATQQQIHRTVVEKENDMYKDQLQALQLTNYSLERKVRELEVKLQLQICSLEKHLGQLTDFENKYSTVVQQGKQLAEFQGALEKQGLYWTQDCIL